MTCPACDSSGSFETVESGGKTTLYRCGECDLQFWHPIDEPGKGWYEQDKCYSMVYSARSYLIPEGFHPKYQLFLKNGRVGGGRLLDIGCGTGKFAARCRDHGFDVVAIDFNRNSIEAARRNWRLESAYHISLEGYRDRYPGDRFQVITLFEVLEHQANARAFLENVRAMLAPRGYVALSVPNRERWRLLPPMNDEPPNHLTRWNRQSLANLMTQCGFDVVEIREIPFTVQSARQVLSGRFLALKNRVLFWGLEKAAGKEGAAGRREERRLFHALFFAWRAAALPPALVICAYARLFSRKDSSIYCLAKAAS